MKNRTQYKRMVKGIIRLPATLVVLIIAMMLMVGELGIAPVYSFENQSTISITIFIIGLLMIAVSGYLFRVAKTTVNPLTPDKTKQLVTTGIYRFSRNPMYIGFLLMLFSCAIFVGSFINLVFFPLYIIVANRLYIASEERALNQLFGDEYEAYKHKVRRWL